MKQFVVCVVAVCAFADIARADSPLLCVQTSAEDSTSVTCITQDQAIRSMAEYTKDSKRWSFTGTRLENALNEARLATKVQGEEVLVVDLARGLHRGKLAPGTRGPSPYQRTLTSLLPSIHPTAPGVRGPNAGFDTDVSITATAGDNTDGQLLYGPPNTGASGWTCSSYSSRDECMNCCFNWMSLQMTTLGGTAAYCHGVVAVNPVGHAICAAAEAAVAATILYQYSKCRGDGHCGQQYWNETSISFTGDAASYMTLYGWGELKDVHVFVSRGAIGLPRRTLIGPDGKQICDIDSSNPLAEEVSRAGRLNVTYEGTPCNIRDYRMLDLNGRPPVVGLIRYDAANGAWMLTRRSGGDLKIVSSFSASGTPISLENGRRRRWADGAKVAFGGVIEGDTLKIGSSAVLREAR